LRRGAGNPAARVFPVARVDRAGLEPTFGVMTKRHLRRKPDHQPGPAYVGSQEQGPVARPEGTDQPPPEMEDEREKKLPRR
jgi:hypothetical protein